MRRRSFLKSLAGVAASVAIPFRLEPPRTPCWNHDFVAAGLSDFNPENWARESLAMLTEQMVSARLIAKDTAAQTLGYREDYERNKRDPNERPNLEDFRRRHEPTRSP